MGTALLSFATLQTLIPVTAWLAPVFLLRFARTQRVLVGCPILVLAISGALLIALRGGFFPVIDGPGYYLFVATLGLGGALPFAVDRILAPRLTGVLRTLVFPAAVTTMEFLGTIGNPFGTAGSTAYSQYAGLPLLQLVSITGIWGLTFLVSWFAPVANEVWERGPSDSGAMSSIGLFAALTAAVLLFGGARLAFSAPGAETVRVAALAPDRHLSELAYAAPDLSTASPVERASVRDEHFTPGIDELFDRSEQQAIGGAKIIVWSEAAARTLEEDQTNVLARAAELAREHKVYLQVSMIVQLATGGSATGGAVNENHAVLLDPNGAIVWDYQKSKPTPGDGHDPGPGIVPTVDTPYGRLATIICQDDFFPDLVRQAGAAQVDILLLPSSDWDSVAAWHAQQTPFRAIENGAAVVRPTRQGISLATDAQGRLLGHKADYFVAEEHTLVASVPTEGTPTWYSVGGDAFAWASAAGVLVLAGAAFRPGRHRRDRS
ncbi:UNVERIFIED_CONTAM: nitrilase-related carbon-nitrogen hydrolase [Kocuria sp. CPCC 205316]|uniref:nitrilase-related carbon-nitrogen hydrolase n=1 Tax=Kocuria TaxID=57493 RepID=UPI0036DEE9C2